MATIKQQENEEADTHTHTQIAQQINTPSQRMLLVCKKQQQQQQQQRAPPVRADDAGVDVNSNADAGAVAYVI